MKEYGGFFYTMKKIDLLISTLESNVYGSNADIDDVVRAFDEIKELFKEMSDQQEQILDDLTKK